MKYFKLAQEGDLQQIKSIIHEAYKPINDALSRPPGVLKNTVEKISHTLRNNQLYGILDENHILIGTFSLAPTNRKTIKMFHFAIKPKFQKQGTGNCVVFTVIKMIQKQMPEKTEIELEIYSKISSLLRFYKKLGFTQIGEKHIKGEKILILSKKI
ncbi:MAG: GNAT family N-acetyltransferase [Candidatus Hodarchaeales archaeon]